MGKSFEITSSTLNSSFEYKNDSIIVQGSFSKDAKTDSLQSINGTCYRNNGGNMGDNFGYFNGYPNGEEITYDLSQMKRADSNLTWDAIEDIETEVLTPNAGEE